MSPRTIAPIKRADAERKRGVRYRAVWLTVAAVLALGSIAAALRPWLYSKYPGSGC